MPNPGDEWAAGEVPEEPRNAASDHPRNPVGGPGEAMLPPVTVANAIFGLTDLARHLRRKLATSTYAVVAEEYGVNKGILWKIVHTDYIPRNPRICAALGLPPRGTVDLAPGITITSGAMVITSSRVCPCGQSFIPNHPARRYCPSCRPARNQCRISVAAEEKPNG